MFNPIKAIVDVEHALEARYFGYAGVVGVLSLTILEDPQSVKATPVLVTAGKDAFYKHMTKHNIIKRNFMPFQLFALNDGFKATADVVTALEHWYKINDREMPLMLGVCTSMKDMPPIGLGMVLLGVARNIEGWAYILDSNLGYDLEAWEKFVDKFVGDDNSDLDHISVIGIDA